MRNCEHASRGHCIRTSQWRRDSRDLRQNLAVIPDDNKRDNNLPIQHMWPTSPRRRRRLTSYLIPGGSTSGHNR